ncbi:MAG: YdcF family protein [Gemmatimonadota bacterium]
MRQRSRVGVLLVYLAAAAVTGWLLSFGAVLLWSKRDTSRTSDVVVVLGAAQYDGKPSPVLKARLDHAHALWKNGLAPKVILTGGQGRGDTTSEAAVGRNYLRRLGVPSNALLQEDKGRSSEESMAAVAELMRNHDMESATFVSDPFHMLRVELIARRHGIRSASSPTRTSPISANQRSAIGYLASESLKVPWTAIQALRTLW